VTILFIVSDSHLKKVEVLKEHIPWHGKLLRNHCIFALNKVHTATTVEDSMHINMATPQETIQEILNNHPPNDDIPYDPYQSLAVLGAGGENYELPDANIAVALSFQDGFEEAPDQPLEANTLNPIVYFVKRETLMYCIDHPTDQSKKDVAFSFIKNNFDHVYLCNDDDLRIPVSSVTASNPKLSKWHCLLDFLGTLRVAGQTSIYPPLSMVHFFEDKFQQKKMLGSASLPYFQVQLPQQQPTQEDNGRLMWLATSWETLYISLLGNNDRLVPIPNNRLLGIVIKPRFGSGGEGVIILKKVWEFEEDPDEDFELREYTIEAIMVQGDCPATPSEWLSWDNELPGELSPFFVEPYCPCIAETEHRVFFTMPPTGNCFNWMYMVSAEVNHNTGNYSIGPLSLPKDRLKNSLQEMPVALRNQLKLVASKVPALLQGNVYRVDCCMAGVDDYPDYLPRSWVIKEMQLFPVAQSFISSYHHNGPQCCMLADAFQSYIMKCQTPYYPA